MKDNLSEERAVEKTKETEEVVSDTRRRVALIEQQVRERQMYEEMWRDALRRDGLIGQLDKILERHIRHADSSLTTASDLIEGLVGVQANFRQLLIKVDQTLKRVEGENEILRKENEELKNKLEKYEPTPKEEKKKAKVEEKIAPPKKLLTPQERQEALAQLAKEAKKKESDNV